MVGQTVRVHVRPRDGARWRFTPKPEQDTCWLALAAGRLRVDGHVLERELAVFAAGAVEVTAEGGAEFIVASGKPHAWPLVAGSYFAHASEAALAAGERRIAELDRLRQWRR